MQISQRTSLCCRVFLLRFLLCSSIRSKKHCDRCFAFIYKTWPHQTRWICGNLVLSPIINGILNTLPHESYPSGEYIRWFSDMCWRTYRYVSDLNKSVCRNPVSSTRPIVVNETSVLCQLWWWFSFSMHSCDSGCDFIENISFSL